MKLFNAASCLFENEILDRLLDKISAQGEASLSHSERLWLNKYAQNQNPGTLVTFNVKSLKKHEKGVYGGITTDGCRFFKLRFKHLEFYNAEEMDDDAQVLYFLFSVTGDDNFNKGEKPYTCGRITWSANLKIKDVAIDAECINDGGHYTIRGKSLKEKHPELWDAAQAFVLAAYKHYEQIG